MAQQENFQVIRDASFSYEEGLDPIVLSDYSISSGFVTIGEFAEVINWGIQEFHQGRTGIEIYVNGLEVSLFYNGDDASHSLWDEEEQYLPFPLDSLALYGEITVSAKMEKAPVINMTWMTALIYCNLRSLMEGLEPCYNLKDLSCDFSKVGYRLPTEAELFYLRLSNKTGSNLPEVYAPGLEYCWDIYEDISKRNQKSGRDPYGAKTGSGIVVSGLSGEREREFKEAENSYARFRLVRSLEDSGRNTVETESPRYKWSRLVLSTSLGSTGNNPEIFMGSLMYLLSPVNFFSFGAGIYISHDWNQKGDDQPTGFGFRMVPVIIGDCSKFAAGISFSITPVWDFFIPNHDYLLSLHFFLFNFHLEFGCGQNDRSYSTGTLFLDYEEHIDRDFVFFMGLGYSLGF